MASFGARECSVAIAKQVVFKVKARLFCFAAMLYTHTPNVTILRPQIIMTAKQTSGIVEM